MEILIKILAVLIAMVLGDKIVAPIAERIRKEQNILKTESEKWVAKHLGCLERGMCVVAWFLGSRKFLIYWLGIKALGNWGGKEGRGKFSNFLFLSALSLSMAVIVAWLAECIIVKFFTRI